jgi:PAS domain S-box-containing protein
MKNEMIKKTGRILSVVFVISVVLSAFATAEEAKVYKIGVLAKRGTERCLVKWTATADYLTETIENAGFEIVPLSFEQVYPNVEAGKVDFVIANSSFYVNLEVRYGASRIATLKNLRQGKVCTMFGGVIISKTSSGIGKLANLKGKTFMAVEETSFGGWQMAWRELKGQGIDPYKDFADLQFGGTHDAVVYAVGEGKVDAGTVRTDTLERMATEGKIDIDDYKILFGHDEHKHLIKHDNADESFPFAHNTSLYPEWPFAKTAETPDEIAEKVTAALLSMSADSDAAKAARCAGWTIPQNYAPVHDCLMELRIAPYEDYGKITIAELVRQYWPWLLGAAGGILTIVVFAIRTRRLNIKLSKSNTEREQAKKAIEQSHTNTKTILEKTQVGVVVIGKDKKIRWANESAIKMAGIENVDVIIGKSCNEYLCPAEQNKCPILDENKKVDNSERILRRYDGKVIPIIKTVNEINFNNENVLLETFIDITERKQAEEQVAVFQKLAEASGQGFGMADLDGTIVYVNPTLCRLLGEEKSEDVIGKKFFSYYSEEIQNRLRNEVLSTVMRGEQWIDELAITSVQGKTTPTNENFFLIRDGNGNPLYIADIISDITDRKQAEKTLKQTTELLQSVMDSSIREIIIATNPTGIILSWNKGARNLLGYEPEEVVGKESIQLFHSEGYLKSGMMDSTIENMIATGEPIETELTYVAKDGKTFHALQIVTPRFDEDGEFIGMLGMSRDITERKAMESQLRQSEKLQSIGQLASGIAHEINTPTQYIGDNINFLQKSFKDILRLLSKYEQVRGQAEHGKVDSELLCNIQDTIKEVDIGYLTEEVPRAIQESLEGVGSVARLVQAMKEFAHPGAQGKTAADINHLIESTIMVTQNRWKYIADMKTYLDPELPPVHCLAGEFNQVILNLIVNAADAIVEKVGEGSEDKGIISISSIHDGEWAEIRVADTGSGIPEEIHERILDPFFTTKEIDKGSGQGLAITYAIVVDKHGGTLTFETETGKGTTFIIRLPIEQDVSSEN